MTKMEMHDVISKLEFMRNGYQKLIDENVDCGTIVGTDITGTWRAETPLNDVYKQHVEALDTAIKVLSAQPDRQWIPCSERLPEDDTEVFVYLFNRPLPYIAWVKDCHWFTEDFEVEKENYPSAWVPLPELYKEKQDEYSN